MLIKFSLENHFQVDTFGTYFKNTKMFSTLFDASRRSPFKVPFSRAQCEAPPTNAIEDQQQLVPRRNIAAAAVAEGDSCEFGSTQYFLLCGIGGIVSCGKDNAIPFLKTIELKIFHFIAQDRLTPC